MTICKKNEGKESKPNYTRKAVEVKEQRIIR